MKPSYVILIIFILLILVIAGMNEGWFKSQPVAKNTATKKQTTAPVYEAGKTYVDPSTGGKIVCYKKQPGQIPLPTIFGPDNTSTNPPTPGAKGTLYSQTNDTACYLFPAGSYTIPPPPYNENAGPLGQNYYTLQLPKNFPGGNVVLGNVLLGAGA